MRGAFAAHPRGKSFIEPEIVPPSHGHEIPKPHVRHLMCNDLINILLSLGGGVLRIEKKERLEIGDASPVFHGPTEASRNSDLIQFREWIRHAKIIVVVLQNLLRGLE